MLNLVYNLDLTLVITFLLLKLEKFVKIVSCSKVSRNSSAILQFDRLKISVHRCSDY